MNRAYWDVVLGPNVDVDPISSDRPRIHHRPTLIFNNNVETHNPHSLPPPLSLLKEPRHIVRSTISARTAKFQHPLRITLPLLKEPRHVARSNIIDRTAKSHRPLRLPQPLLKEPHQVAKSAITDKTITSSEDSIGRGEINGGDERRQLPSLFGLLPAANSHSPRIDNQAGGGMTAPYAPLLYNLTRPLPCFKTAEYLDTESVVRTSGHLKRTFDRNRISNDNGNGSSNTNTRDGSGVSANAMARRIDGIYKAMKRGGGKKGSTQHLCTECGKSFKRETFLKKHHAAVHLKIKPYACSVCDKRFGYKCVRDKHTRVIHLKEKPVECKAEGCFRRFSERGNMLKHHKNIHETSNS